MSKATKIRLANHHTGPIVLPRIYNPNISGDPAQMTARCEATLIASGGFHDMEPAEWELRKKSPALQYYLDKGIMSVVKPSQGVDIVTDRTIELEIPEHLQADDEGAVSATSAADPSVKVKAKLTTTKGSVTL